MKINNAFYDDLGEKWLYADDHPIALLQAENRLRSVWIAEVLEERKPCRILDVGCGGGLLSNFLSLKGHDVHGIDLSAPSLEIAKKHDVSQRVCYERASAYELPFPKKHFDVVCALDLLEHVEDPHRVIAESARVLRPGGLFFFHTFNRTLLSWLLVIKGVEWFVKATPDHMHVYRLFLKPDELERMCAQEGMEVRSLRGCRPDFKTRSFWRMLFTRRVDTSFRFVFTPSLLTGYCGFSIRTEKGLK